MLLLSNVLIISLQESANFTCNGSMDDEVNQCLQPFMELWVDIRAEKSRLNDVRFPLFFHKQDDLMLLCEDWMSTQRFCLSKKMQRACYTNPLLRFTRSFLGYGCASPEDSKHFFAHYQCISDIVRQMDNCSDLILGPSLPGLEVGKCANMSQFYYCVMPQVLQTCSMEAGKVLQASIQEFGCPIAAKSCPIEETVSNCTQSFLALWDSIGLVDPKIKQLEFPVFNIDRINMLDLCDRFVSMRDRCFNVTVLSICPEHPVFELTENLFGYACNSRTTHKFFRNSQCVAELLEKQQNCFQFVNKSLNGNSEFKRCDRLMKFYDCWPKM